MDDWTPFIDSAIKGIIGAMCVYGVRLLSEMNRSIDELNEKMAQILERTKWHSKAIEQIELRLLKLERERHKYSHDDINSH